MKLTFSELRKALESKPVETAITTWQSTTDYSAFDQDAILANRSDASEDWNNAR